MRSVSICTKNSHCWPRQVKRLLSQRGHSQPQRIRLSRAWPLRNITRFPCNSLSWQSFVLPQPFTDISLIDFVYFCFIFQHISSLPFSLMLRFFTSKWRGFFFFLFLSYETSMWLLHERISFTNPYLSCT